MRASDAPEEVQDAVADRLMADLEADPKLQMDDERLIAAWFAGQGPLAYGDKKFWGEAPVNSDGQTTVGYNPSVRKYVDGVLTHARELAG